MNMMVLSAWTRYERKATTKMNVEIVHFAELIKFTSENKRNNDIPLGGAQQRGGLMNGDGERGEMQGGNMR